MEKTIKTIIIIALILVGTAVIFSAYKTKSTKLGGGFVTECFDTAGNDCRSLATTTVKYLTADGATTTLSFFAPKSDSIDINVSFTASTSASVLVWNYKFSNDNINFYGENGRTTSNNTLATEGATILTHSWAPGASGTSTKNVTINPTGSRYHQYNFSVSGANGALYVQAVPRTQIQN